MERIRQLSFHYFIIFLAFICLSCLLFISGEASAGAIIVDHTTTDLSKIPDDWIMKVKQNIKVYFGHTSHGSQVTNGLKKIESQYGSKYLVAIDWSLPNKAGALCIRDRADTYNPEDFFPTVPGALSTNPTINVVIYGWCNQPTKDNWRTLLNNYIAQMQALEKQYPHVIFVYMTANAQENDRPGCNRHLFNEELRHFVRKNNKVLFDFADLDTWYNGKLSTYNAPSWSSCAGQSIPREHPHWGGGNWNNPCGHSTYESCVNKGKAMWWLLARIAGWSGIASHNITPLSTPATLR